MSPLYEYIRHPRLAELRAHGPVKTKDLLRTNSENVLVRLNAKFGLRITLVVGTMWAAYVFTILALFALPSAIKQGTYFIIVWLSSSFLQLVLLPIIIVGQNIQAAAADKRSEETYKDAEAVLKESAEIQHHLHVQDEAITNILDRLEKLVSQTESKGPST
jgi:hypothetical protein